MVTLAIKAGNDCAGLFKQAYQNRYTWGQQFQGYQGSCSYRKDGQTYTGEFQVARDLKVEVVGFQEESIQKLISTQLWEVGIHRVRRPFEQVHGANTFTAGETNDVGLEVIVGGKNRGDKYRIRNNIVTKVERHMHGRLIVIHTEKVFFTDDGYLSNLYTSQYFDSKTLKPMNEKSFFIDEHIPISDNGPWVLSSRCISQLPFKEALRDTQTFSFFNMRPLE